MSWFWAEKQISSGFLYGFGVFAQELGELIQAFGGLEAGNGNGGIRRTADIYRHAQMILMLHQSQFLLSDLVQFAKKLFIRLFMEQSPDVIFRQFCQQRHADAGFQRGIKRHSAEAVFNRHSAGIIIEVAYFIFPQHPQRDQISVPGQPVKMDERSAQQSGRRHALRRNDVHAGPDGITPGGCPVSQSQECQRF